MSIFIENKKIYILDGWYPQNLEVYVSTSNRTSSFKTQCGAFMVGGGDTQQFTCPTNTQGSYVTVQRRTRRSFRALVLCNVEVYVTKGELFADSTCQTIRFYILP